MATPATKTRSPNYPVISLQDAIGRVRTIYDKQKMYPTNRQVLATLLGYGTLNGASATLISALSKYGLLEGYGDNLRVSSLGQDLVLHEKGDPEYAEALRQAAAMPAFFQDLRERYPDGLPSEHSLRVTLIKRGFNPKAIDNALRAYRDTMEFVDAELSDLATNSSEDEWAEPMQEQAAQLDDMRYQARVGSGARSVESEIALPGGADQVLVFKIAEESEARIAFRGRVTQEAIQKLRQLLELSEDTFPTKESLQTQVSGTASDE